MKSLLIAVAIVLSLAVSAVADEPREEPRQVGNIELRLADIQRRMSVMELTLINQGRRIYELEHMNYPLSRNAECDCDETGTCTCTAENCKCKNCPEHGQSRASCWLTDIPREGRTAILFTGRGCRPCEKVKAELCEDGIACRVVLRDIEDHASLADQLHVSSVPALRLVDDRAWRPDNPAQSADGAGEIDADKIRDWLAGVTQGTAPRVTYRVVSGPTYSACSSGSCSSGACRGGACYSGGCSSGSCSRSAFSPARSYCRPVRRFSRCAGGRCR